MKENTKALNTKRLIKKCHMCGHMHDTIKEIQKCTCCNKSFLPVRYFEKVHAKSPKDFNLLFSNVSELHEEEIIKGLTVIW